MFFRSLVLLLLNCAIKQNIQLFKSFKKSLNVEDKIGILTSHIICHNNFLSFPLFLSFYFDLEFPKIGLYRLFSFDLIENFSFLILFILNKLPPLCKKILLSLSLLSLSWFIPQYHFIWLWQHTSIWTFFFHMPFSLYI